MPPVQEQLLLTDTEQTGDQGVQGLRKKKTTSPEDYSPTNQVTHVLWNLLMWPVWARINRVLITQRWIFHKGFLMTMGMNNLELYIVYKFHVQ